MQVTWLVGWYATRQHAVIGPTSSLNVNPSYHEIVSLCGQVVYEKPRTDWARRKLSSANSIPKCSRCLKKLSNMEKGNQ